MFRMFGGVLITLMLSVIVIADDPNWPDTHPCTGAAIPLSSEKAVVSAIECLYEGRVAKVSQVTNKGSDWYYELRVLIPGGRVKTLDVHPQTGLPLEPTELEAVYEALNR